MKARGVFMVNAPWRHFSGQPFFILSRFLPWLCIFVVLMPGKQRVGGVQPVPLTVAERTGVARSNEWAVFGVPLPRSWQLTNLNRLLLRDDSTPCLPAQFEILARWGSHASNPAAPAKWVLVTYPASVAAHSRQTVYLEAGTGASPAFPQLTIDQPGPDRMRVDTGAALFELNIDSFNLFEQITISGQPLLAPLTPSQAIQYRGINGITVVHATRLQPRRANRAVLERNGPFYAVIKATGSILDEEGRAVLDYTGRYHFYAGKTEVRLDFTVENNYPVLAGENDEPLNAHNQGGTNSVYIGSLRLALQLAAQASPLHLLMENSISLAAPSAAVRLYQDSSGLPEWNNYVGLTGWETNVDCAPRLQSYCSLPGYEITGAGGSITGRQALGWATLYRAGSTGPRLQVAVRDFWQNFPKAIEAETNGTVAVDLFPNGQAFHHNLRVGEEKTHTLLFHFGLGAESAERSEQRARAFNAPLRGQFSPAWMVQTKAMGEVPVKDPAQWPLYEHNAGTAFDPNPDFDPDIHDASFGNTTLREVIERYNFFGWQDYGDVPLDYEAFGPNQAGQMNLKYWYLYGMLAQYGRSGDGRWLDLALPAAWHLADIDYLHIPDEGIQHWVHGAYFGHSNHDEPGNLNPNRNSNSPSVDLFFGVPDLLLGYHLTGENRFLEVAREGLEAMLNQSQFADFSGPYIYRERANLTVAFMEGYRQTGDARWLTALRTVVGATTSLTNKVWMNDPHAFRPEENWHWLSSFSLSQVLWSIGRYLDFCAEYDLSDDLGAAQALTAYSDFILRHFTLEYRPGRMAAWNAFYFYDPHEDPYLEINSWALVMADVLAYAHKYSGRVNYLEAAAKFFATGTIDPVWEDDVPVYMATKDLVNTLNWGLVFMKISHAEANPLPRPPRLSIHSFNSQETVLQWEPWEPNYRYSIEFADRLPSMNWHALTEKPLATNSWTDSHPGLGQRFWRLKIDLSLP